MADPGSPSSFVIPEGVIQVETTVTVEEYFVDPPAASEPLNPRPTVVPNAVFGDSSNFYQATITAASHFARNLFDTTTPQIADDGFNTIQNRPRARGWLVTALLLAAVNLSTAVIESMIGVMAPTIIYDLDVQGFQWLFAGPAIGAAATVLTAAQLYAVCPFKHVYIFFAALLLLGTISPGFTPNMEFLFFARVLLGIGMAGQHFGALIYLEHEGAFVDKVRRDFFLTVSSTLGFVLGPIFACLFTHRDKKWGWAFYTSFIVLALLLCVVVYMLPKHLNVVAPAPWTYTESLPWNIRFSYIDYVGSFLSFFGIIVFFITFNLAGTSVPWTSGYLYIFLGLGAILLILFVIQQSAMIITSPSTRLFPKNYLRQFKLTMLFLLTSLTSGIYFTIIPWTAFRQLVAQPSPSAVGTAFYLFFTTTGPHLIPTIFVAAYIGSGLIARYPLIPSYSIWSVVTAIFLLTGSILLFVNAPAFMAGGGGLPSIARRVALACIGFWSAVTLPLGHQMMDLARLTDRQRHPHHNRGFVLFATYLGPAIALTAAGSIFMQVGARLELSVLAAAAADPAVPATKENALVLLLGYTFTRGGYSESVFAASLVALETTFGWSSIVLVLLAAGVGVVSGGLLVAKLLQGGLDATNVRVPREWFGGAAAGGRLPGSGMELGVFAA